MARRPTFASTIVLALGLALGGGCATTDATAEDPGVAVGESPLTARDLAGLLGLRVRPVDGLGRMPLEAWDGDRILLFPGSRTITVRGVRYEAQQPVAGTGDDALIAAADARVVREMWISGIGADRPSSPLSLPPSRSDELPPLPPPLPREAAAGGAAPSTQQAALSALERREWAVPLRRKWDYIVIHHSASASGSAAAFDRVHREERGWDGLGYDFVIGNGNGSPDGKVEVGYRWRDQVDGAHAKDKLMNQHGVGICLVGDFTKSRPTAAQMRSLQRLCDFLAAYCGIPASNLRRHSDVRDTECPGKLFPGSFTFRPMPGVRRGATASSN